MPLECSAILILILEDMEDRIKMILKKTLTQTIMMNMSRTLIMREKRKSM